MAKKKNLKKINQNNTKIIEINDKFLNKTVQITLPGVAILFFQRALQFSLAHKELFQLETDSPSDVITALSSLSQDMQDILEAETEPQSNRIIN